MAALARVRPLLMLSLIAAAALLVHGYHLGADDAAIYVPGIKKAADPMLYPVGSEFFMSHAHLSLFPDLVGGSARLTRLPIDLIIFIWHAASILLLLLACHRLLSLCFVSGRARWAGVALLAATLTVPVAGTALLMMDPYVTARSLSTPMTLFAATAWLSGQHKRAVCWLAATAVVHPQMAAYGALFFASVAIVRAWERLPADIVHAGVGLYLITPLGLFLDPPTGAAREALFSRTYFFVFNWTWYEWAGVFAPLALLWWAANRPPKCTTPVFTTVCRALVPFGLFATAAAVFFEMSPRLENLARLQPMRSFHLVYVIFFAMLGGILGEYVLQASAARWAALFVPLAVTMWSVQRAEFAGSPHLEWPGAASHNPWISAFLWVRGNTPKNAVFALNPKYMLSPGEDAHGFRAIAERSALADEVKDSGAVSLFPALAPEWKTEVQAESRQFAVHDFRTLARRYHVNWVIMLRPVPAGATCPYTNEEVEVCRVAR